MFFILFSCIIVYDTDRPRILTRIPDSEFVAVTGEDGHRVYMVLKDDDDISNEVSSLLIYCTCVKLILYEHNCTLIFFQQILI